MERLFLTFGIYLVKGIKTWKVMCKAHATPRPMLIGRGIHQDVRVDIQQLSCNAKCQEPVEETRQTAGGRSVA